MAAMSILYPIAGSADEALHAPKGFAAREREAQDAAGSPVAFQSEAVGPAFATREALSEAYRTATAQPWCAVRPVAAGKVTAPVKPQNAEGRRWPEPKAIQPSFWRLSISYWRIEAADQVPSDHARKLRRDPRSPRTRRQGAASPGAPAASRAEAAAAPRHRPVRVSPARRPRIS